MIGDDDIFRDDDDADVDNDVYNTINSSFP